MIALLLGGLCSLVALALVEPKPNSIELAILAFACAAWINSCGYRRVLRP